jgi:flagellar hook-length control protein FliK
MSVQASQLPTFTQPTTEAKSRVQSTIKDRDADEFSGMMREQAVKKRDEAEARHVREPGQDRPEAPKKEQVQQREAVAEGGKDLPRESQDSADPGDADDAQALSGEEALAGENRVDALLGELGLLAGEGGIDQTLSLDGQAPAETSAQTTPLLEQGLAEPLLPERLLSELGALKGVEAQRGDASITQAALSLDSQPLDSVQLETPDLGLEGLVQAATAQVGAQASAGVVGEVRGQGAKLAPDSANTNTNSSPLHSASWASQLQSLDGGEGGEFDEGMQRGFSAFRESLGGQLGPQLGADESLKGFNQIMSQMNAARPAAAAAAATAALETATPAMPQARPLELPVGSKQWGEGVGERIQWMMNRGMEQAQIRLNPQHLGPLEIRLSMTNDQANVSIMAQHAVTRDAIEQSLPRLREMLQDANLNLANVDVGQREAAPHREQAQRGRGPDGRGFGEEAAERSDGEEELAVSSAPRQKLGLISEFA